MILWLLACTSSEPGVELDTDPVHTDSDAPPVTEDRFRLIVIPDVQIATESYPEILQTMVSHAAVDLHDPPVAFVLQEGDLTQKNTADQWDTVRGAFEVLDDFSVPYAVCVGNHDMGPGRDTTQFNEAFRIEDYVDLDAFGGSFRADEMDNVWYTFRVDEADWLILSLTYEPPDEVLDWGASVVAAHPTHRAILLTHAYLVDDRRTSVGERIWSRLVAPASTIQFVFNGHYTGAETGYLLSENDAGLPVHQLFVNFQTRTFGGLGLLRSMDFDPTAGTIDVRTYSPWIGHEELGEDDAFTLTGVELGPMEASR